MLSQIVKTESKPFHFFQFDDLNEMVSRLRKTYEESPDAHAKNYINSVTESPRFVGRSFDSISHAFAKSQNLWAEGLAIFNGMLNEVRQLDIPRPTNIRRTARWSEDSGDEVCLDRLKAGNPYWRTTARDTRPGPQSVTIVAGLGANAKVKWEDILWRGIAAVCLTEILEAAGYRVELWGVRLGEKVYNDRHGLGYAVCLKRPQDTLDSSTIVNTVSGWFYRTVGFCASMLRGSHYSGIGSSIGSKPILPLITQDEHVFLCDELWTQEDVIQWITDSVANFS